jgi:hypothetical protein
MGLGLGMPSDIGAPRRHRQAGGDSLCGPRASHRQYSTIAYGTQQEAGVGRDPQPNKRRFTVRRILGAVDLWVTEFFLTYDGQPSCTASIMEFEDGKVARETQYFGDAFEPGPSRARWVERMR